MIHKLRGFIVAAALATVTHNSIGQALPPPQQQQQQNSQPAPLSPPQKDFSELISQIRAKLQKGQKAEADFGPELKQFDALLAKYKNDKSEDVAHIAYMKAMLYAQVFENFDKAAELVKQTARDFPDSQLAKNADKVIDSLQMQAKAKKVQEGLAAGTKFPDFNETDTAGKPLSVADHKGKVVLVDFWATWCPPCRAELPNVIDTYKKYHDKGFDIIGVSLDTDKSKLLDFTKEQGMVWPQYYDGLQWSNKLAVKYGVVSIPSTYLIDTQGRIITNGARGEELQAAVAKALAAK